LPSSEQRALKKILNLETKQPRYKTPFSSRLRLKLRLVLPIISKADRSFEQRKDFPNRFKDFLIIVHSIIRASVPLMKAAELECKQLKGDNLCSDLAKYYHEHSIEEMNHDEWLIDDLKLLEVSREEVLSKKPSQTVAELVGSQYYWIHHLHPCYLLGYILVLEGYPLGKKDLDRLLKKTGFPEKSFRTLAEHSSLDVHHLEELDKTLDQLPLSEKHEEWITLNAIYTIRKCAEILYSS